MSLGICAARDLKCCVRDLKGLIAGIQTIKREMRYSLAPLPDLLRLASAQTFGEVQLFFADCLQKVESMEGGVFGSIWEQALSRRKFCFKREDFAVLTQLGSVLGRYDADEQLNALEETIERLEQRCERASEESRRMGKVYTVLGGAAGLFALILLL